MVDIYRYIKSNAIKDYLKKKNYEFDLIEAVQLINCSDYRIEDKFNAIKELLNQYTDSDYKKIKNLINWFISNKEKELAKFKDNKNAVFRYNILWDKPLSLAKEEYQNDCKSLVEYTSLYSSFEKCIEAIKKTVRNSKVDPFDKNCEHIPISISIDKVIIDANNKQIDVAYLNNDFNIKKVIASLDGESDVNIDELDLPDVEYDLTIPPNIPIPFKDGDLVCDIDYKDKPIYIKRNNINDYKYDDAYAFYFNKNNEKSDVEYVNFDPNKDIWTDAWLTFEFYAGSEDER